MGNIELLFRFLSSLKILRAKDIGPIVKSVKFEKDELRDHLKQILRKSTKRKFELKAKDVPLVEISSTGRPRGFWAEIHGQKLF